MHKIAGGVALVAILAGSAALGAATPENGGPYNVSILEGGVGVSRPLQSPVLAANAPFTISGWVKPDTSDGTILAVGDSPET
ncbi:MAG TPA: hypothetical protein VI407_05745, partial [Erythrobacter sp.]